MDRIQDDYVDPKIYRDIEKEAVEDMRKAIEIKKMSKQQNDENDIKFPDVDELDSDDEEELMEEFMLIISKDDERIREKYEKKE